MKFSMFLSSNIMYDRFISELKLSLLVFLQSKTRFSKHVSRFDQFLHKPSVFPSLCSLLADVYFDSFPVGLL